MKNEYFDKLYEMVGDHGRSSYRRLSEILFNYEFFSYIPNDDNRNEDGLYLRELYLNEVDGQHPLYSFPKFNNCSVLEALIGIVSRCNDIVSEKSIQDWVYELFDNLNLTRYTDYYIYRQESCTDEILNIIDVFVERVYEKDGTGGLFPLEFSTRDERKVEIWYQMNAYILERYSFV